MDEYYRELNTVTSALLVARRSGHDRASGLFFQQAIIVDPYADPPVLGELHTSKVPRIHKVSYKVEAAFPEHTSR